ncbi:vacuolar iron transporter family protein [Purpureocillium lavendulum]|uniref:Vacuolar iron transporter family protein n=1 Tax=Purpureocillium lavendulum TaxID=1247861 RepID=A0AB34FTR0_9HYPO|nr:vacuolar iron transporter family protein [Purpureocillium lavendulum]
MAYPSETSPLLPEPPSERQVACSKLARRDASPGHSSTSSSSSSSSAPDGLSDTLRDIIIGFSDGLTVPFALTAGLSSLGSTRLVIMGGLAELISGMISMGLGAYLAAVTERDRYRSQRAHARGGGGSGSSPSSSPYRLSPAERQARRDDVYAILDRYAVSRAAATPLVDELCGTLASAPDGNGNVNGNDDYDDEGDGEAWLRFKMDVGLRLDEPETHAAWLSGVTMGLSYFVGGLVPMLPYFAMDRVSDALLVSVAVTVVILLAFGYVKNYVAIRTHRAGVWGALQTLVIGVLAAGTSYAIVKALDRGNP